MKLIRWVGQEDPMGCFVAAMAMVAGKTYAEVKAETGECWRRGGTFFPVDQYLSENRLVTARYWSHDQFRGHAENGAWLCDKRDPWPPAPFAPVHLCEVRASAGHWVVMLKDGTVLDPNVSEPRKLSDYSEVYLVIGVWSLDSLEDEPSLNQWAIRKDYTTDHPDRCRVRDDSGSWRCHKNVGHAGECSTHWDCGEMSSDRAVCGYAPGHSGPHAWEAA
jgi:hypothetical protein